MSQINYEKDIEIDENSLDIEWLDQPKKMLKYAKHAAQMRRELDISKQNLDIAKSEADKKIRNNPEKYKIEKVTENTVAAAIIIESGYKTAYEEYLEAKYESEMASNALTAFEQRKSALENLVKLHGQQYFSGPSVPRDLQWEREEKQKAVNQKLGKVKRNN